MDWKFSLSGAEPKSRDALSMAIGVVMATIAFCVWANLIMRT